MELRKMLPEFLQEYLFGLRCLYKSGNIEENTNLITSLKYFPHTITENCPIDIKFVANMFFYLQFDGFV